MKTVVAAILFLGICILAMCMGIIVKGRFPETEISRNKEMRRRGIKCMNEEEEERRHGVSRNAGCTGTYSDACKGCGFYPLEFGGEQKK